MSFLTLAPALFCAFVALSNAAVDETIVSGAKGRDVVDAVIYKIANSQIFPNDYRFLIRVGWVESKFGDDEATYRPEYYGGIWQVDRIGFDSTQDVASHPSLVQKIEAIRTKFGIDWRSVTWNDLTKPLYSGLAARLFVSNIPASIPETIAGQADYWKNYYNSGEGAGTVQKFIADVHALEDDNQCSSPLNVVAVLDGSSSIGNRDFTLARSSIAQLLSKFELTTAEMGFVVYSNDATTIFPLTRFTNTSHLQTLVTGANQPGGGTATDLAILETISLFDSRDDTNNEARVMILYTDGVSNSPPLTTLAANQAFEKKITAFAVGIGSGIKQDELLRIAANVTEHVVAINNFETLLEIIGGLIADACTVPQRPAINETQSGTLRQGSKTYFLYDFPESDEGITINLAASVGKVQAYYSYDISKPSSALHEGSFTNEAFLPNPHARAHAETEAQMGPRHATNVYIAVEGLEQQNTFEMKAREGNWASGAGMPALNYSFLLVATLVSAILAF